MYILRILTFIACQLFILKSYLKYDNQNAVTVMFP